LHQIGLIYQKAELWQQAEESYRNAAQIWDRHCLTENWAKTANQLAIVLELSGKLEEAEAWYCKVIETDRKAGNLMYLARHLSNLASLLRTQGNLLEACKLAQEAISISQTLDPAATQIWTTYGILAQIATQQGETAKAQDYRRLSRQSYAAFAGSRHALQQWEKLIQGVVAAIGDAEVHQQLGKVLPKGPLWFATVVQQIWAGVRDEDELCDELGFVEGAIVVEILRRLSV
jgi:tetratricopeptide (TPR) repeat protein